MTLQVYSTLTRKKEPFQTVQPGKVGMYVCGPTVYKPSHVGHMVGPVIFDTVKRWLTFVGYEVTFVVNITDVDDKLIKESKSLGITMQALAERVTADYLDVLGKMHVTGIDRLPKATEHIGDIVAMIGGLVDKGFAYAVEGDVYFDIARDEDYGKLCNRDPEQLEAGARIEVSTKKRNPGDFALWKGAKPGEPFWESPWGPGRPGWHIECSAMTKAILGDELDIHGGGLDLTFPHHENELAQSESANGCTFARYWMHNGLMKIRSQAGKIKGDAAGTIAGAPEGDEPSGTVAKKMGKSEGNAIVVTEVFKKFAPETLRFLLLNTHYRSPIEYGEERLVEVRKSLDGFYRLFERFERIAGRSFFDLPTAKLRTTFETTGGNGEFLTTVQRLRETFFDCMDDDFNTGGAIGTMHETLNAINRYADVQKLDDAGASSAAIADLTRAVTVLREYGQILGIFQERVEAAPGANDAVIGGLMTLLIELRNEARKSKNFAQADEIRKRLTTLGVTLEDRSGETGWRIG